MTSPQFQAVVATIPDNFASPDADYREVRATMAPFHGQPLSDDVIFRETHLGGIRCGNYRLRDSSDERWCFLHIHGGALVSCPLDHYHFYAEIILRQLGHQVVMPDYRLAPEARYPAAANDCLAAYKGLIDTGMPADRIIMLGESCGGGLGLCALLLARDSGLPMPAAFVSLTGWYDLSVATPPVGREPFLTPEWVRNRGREYTGGKLPLDDPRVSPSRADLHSLPPLYLQVGQFDTMTPGALELAHNATLAGVQVRVDSWPGMIQGWHGLVGAGVPEAEAAWNDIQRYVSALDCSS
ncbi:alpha/beta hydrolase fold domain-containing protein [Parahaliea mediterranea]|uniref:alpha/beta hydrolase fold domain-containing protein n=1 Tax=Parahaliea mediterranea TaxID=651086 RepID=UPI000E2ECC0E|nr:alpha/beta hydrolase fold domain-containing protein [Parahaliea mediterranea]